MSHGLSRRQFTKEFKLAAVRRLEQGVSIGEAARALEVNPNVLHRWRCEFRQGPGNAFPEQRKAALVGRPDRGVGAEGWAAGAGDRFFEGVRGLTIARMVELGGVSRANLYRDEEDVAVRPDRDMDLRDAIQRIALEWPSYVRSRITDALRRELHSFFFH